MTTTPRQRKTPQQRAEETLAVAKRRVTRLDQQAREAHDTWQALVDELREAEARLDYAHQDPALQGSTTPSRPDQTGDTTA